MNWITSDDLLRSVGRVYPMSASWQVFVAEAEVVYPNSTDIVTWHSPFGWIEDNENLLMPNALEETMQALLPENTQVVYGPVKHNRVFMQFVDNESDKFSVGKPWDENPHSGRYWCVLAKHIPTGKYAATRKYDTMIGQYKPLHDKQVREVFFKDFPITNEAEYENIAVMKYAMSKLLNAPIIG